MQSNHNQSFLRWKDDCGLNIPEYKSNNSKYEELDSQS